MIERHLAICSQSINIALSIYIKSHDFVQFRTIKMKSHRYVPSAFIMTNF